MRIFTVAATILCLGALSGCHRPPKLTVESSHLDEFQAIDFRGAAELDITVGAPTAFSVKGSESAVKDLETSVRDGTLYLRSERVGWSLFGDQRKLKITISSPQLTTFESSGAGDVRIAGFAGGEHRVRIAGAHNLKASGALDKLTIQLEGAGNVDYSQVVAQSVKVTVNGAGNVEVQPVASLDAQVNGVGAVQYVGEPQKVESAIHGLGAIKRK